jgi:hypothetical protein
MEATAQLLVWLGGRDAVTASLKGGRRRDGSSGGVTPLLLPLVKEL